MTAQKLCKALQPPFALKTAFLKRCTFWCQKVPKTIRTFIVAAWWLQLALERNFAHLREFEVSVAERTRKTALFARSFRALPTPRPLFPQFSQCGNYGAAKPHINPPLGKKGVKKARRKSVKKRGRFACKPASVARFSFYAVGFSLFCLRGRFLRTF